MNRSGPNVLHLFLVRDLGTGLLGRCFPGVGMHPLEGQHHLLFSDQILTAHEHDLNAVPGAVVDDQANALNDAALTAAHEIGHYFTLAHPDASPLLWHDVRNLMLTYTTLWENEDLLERQAELARQSTYLSGN